MTEQRITKLINDLFYDVIETDKVREQKEELRIHLTERVHDYMQAGLSFDEALDAAKEGLGDPEELISGFERKRAIVVDDLEEDYGFNVQFRLSRLMMKIVPLSPFIYVILGITQGSWIPLFPIEMINWWAWGWVIIPMTAILSGGAGIHSIVALSPFIYVLLGFFFGWWAWGWLIIPISAILFSSGDYFSSPGKRKKKKKRVVQTDSIIEVEKNGKIIKINKFTGDIEVENSN